MFEIIDNLEICENPSFLIDTCFLIYELKNNSSNLKKFCNKYDVAMTSFNLEELNYIHNKLDGNLKHSIRSFLKSKTISKVNIGVHPGEHIKEYNFVKSFDKKILDVIHDPSDAVLYTTAVLLDSNILTRDKHHIFTVNAEEYLKKHNIKVYNTLKI